MATLHSDNFNRADENPATGWTTAAQALKVVSNQITSSVGANDNFAFYTAGSVIGDQWAQCTMLTNAASSGGGPAVRMAAGRIGYNLYAYSGASGSDLVRDGTTLIAHNAAGHTSGDVYLVEAVGSTISAKRNGSSIGSGTDATYATGKYGMGMWENTTAGGTTGDDWSGGDYSAANIAGPLVSGPVLKSLIHGGLVG